MSKIQLDLAWGSRSFNLGMLAGFAWAVACLIGSIYWAFHLAHLTFCSVAP